MEPVTQERPRAVFFDWDGTLVDSIPFLFKAHNHVREQLNLTLWDMAEYREHLKFSSQELYSTIYAEKSAEALDILYDFVHREHLGHVKVMDGAAALIEYINGQGIRTGVVSNKRHDVLEKEIHYLGWNRFLDVIVGAGVAVRDKPWADSLLHAFECAGHKPQSTDTWYVGDSEPDMRAAQAAGCAAVLLTNGEDRQNLIDAFGPYKVFRDCGDLLLSLQSLKKAV